MDARRNFGEHERSVRVARGAAESNFLVVSAYLGCVSLGESENGFVIPDHMDSSTPKKRKIRKRIILS